MESHAAIAELDGLGSVLELLKSISMGRGGNSNEGGPISLDIGYTCPGSELMEGRDG